MSRKTVLSTWDAGRYCRVSPYTVRHWVRIGRLPAYTTPGGHRRIRLEDLNAFLKAHRMPLPQDFEEGKRRLLILAADARRLCAEVGRLSPDLDLRGIQTAFEGGLLVGSYGPHLMIVDLDEGGWDGMAVCRSLSHSPEHSHILLAGLSRRSDVDTLERAEASGVQAVFRRPLDSKELLPFLKEHFPNCKWSSLK